VIASGLGRKTCRTTKLTGANRSTRSATDAAHAAVLATWCDATQMVQELCALSEERWKCPASSSEASTTRIEAYTPIRRHSSMSNRNIVH
jgi:hypothetical protein